MRAAITFDKIELACTETVRETPTRNYACYIT